MELKQFKITVVPLRDKLLNYARRMTDDPSDAEDAVQEVMLKLWNLRQKLDEYRSIEAVAMTMTHHLCMDMWRAKRPDTLSLDRWITVAIIFSIACELRKLRFIFSVVL